MAMLDVEVKANPGRLKTLLLKVTRHAASK
jgi:hypothetical protein